LERSGESPEFRSGSPVRLEDRRDEPDAASPANRRPGSSISSTITRMRSTSCMHPLSSGRTSSERNEPSSRRATSEDRAEDVTQHNRPAQRVGSGRCRRREPRGQPAKSRGHRTAPGSLTRRRQRATSARAPRSRLSSSSSPRGTFDRLRPGAELPRHREDHPGHPPRLGGAPGGVLVSFGGSLWRVSLAGLSGGSPEPPAVGGAVTAERDLPGEPGGVRAGTTRLRRATEASVTHPQEGRRAAEG